MAETPHASPARAQAWWTSLVAQAVALLLVVLAGISGPISLYFAKEFSVNFQAELDKRGSSLLSTLERHQDLRLALSLKDAAAARKVMQDVANANEDIAYLGCLDPNGKLIALVDRKTGQKNFDEELLKHALGGGRGNVSDSDMRRFTQRVAADAAEEHGGMELPESAPTTGNARALGYLVMGLRADLLAGHVTSLTLKTVVVTGLFFLVAFLTFFIFISRRVSRMVHFAEQLAAGELSITLEAKGRDELGRLASALQELRDSTIDVVGQMKEAANTLSLSSGEVLRSAEGQLQRSSRQAASVTQTGATVTQLREIFTQARSKAEGVVDLAKVSEANSTTGEQAVQQSVRAMEGMREQVNATASTLERLVQQTKAIGDIIDVVNDLAEQSNMLALNAAIEAARAGESGRGFAVVANEVRSLAERSQQSTAQVQSILDDIETAARDSTNVVEEARRRASAGVELANAAGAAIRELALAISQSSTAALQISGSTSQQSVGVDQIWQAIEDIGRGAAEATAGIGQLRQASEVIKVNSDRMAHLVRRYRIHEAPRA